MTLFLQIDIGVVPIPKSVNKKRIEENIAVFDFKLTPDEIEYIDSFNTGERIIHFTESRNDKYFPFGIEYWSQVILPFAFVLLFILNR